MARRNFTEFNIYLYMHSINDFELIDFVKSQKKSRKLNNLVIRLLRNHIAEERERLLNSITVAQNELGSLPDANDFRDIGYIQRDLIDLDQLKKSFLRIESEIRLLKESF